MPCRLMPCHLVPCRENADRGAVTVEAAFALCALVTFLAVAIGAVVATGASVRCIDAARELARLAARGEPERGRVVAAELAPSGAVLAVEQVDGTVVASVTARLVGPLPLEVGSRAVAAVEPGVGPP